jgi:hypothetical protein
VFKLDESDEVLDVRFAVLCLGSLHEVDVLDGCVGNVFGDGSGDSFLVDVVEYERDIYGKHI